MRARSTRVMEWQVSHIRYSNRSERVFAERLTPSRIPTIIYISSHSFLKPSYNSSHNFRIRRSLLPGAEAIISEQEVKVAT